jgi:hypothetical protein
VTDALENKESAMGWFAIRVQGKRTKKPLRTIVGNAETTQLGVLPGNYLETPAHKGQLWSVILFGLITVPYLLAVRAGLMHRILLLNPWLEIGLLLFFIAIPFLINILLPNQLPTIPSTAIKPYHGDVSRLLVGWHLEQLYVVSVLVVLPPTILFFVWLYLTKTHDLMEPMLVTLHLSLLMRRTNKAAIKRLFYSKKRLMKWSQTQ